jgi:glycosyltransferase involved in cell wall biosynthesis
MVSQPTDGGAAQCVARLARHAQQSGLEVVVASPRGELTDWLAAEGVPWQQLSMRRAPAPGDAAAAVRLRRLVKRADVVHLHSSKAGALGRLAVAAQPRRPRRPAVVFTPHGWSWYAATGAARQVYVAVERALASVPDVIVAVSDGEREEGRRVLGTRARGLRTIHNGVDTTAFQAVGPRAPRSEEPLVVVVGRFAHQKGQDQAIAALGHLRCREARLRLVGIDASSRDAVRALAHDGGVADRVEVVGLWGGGRGHAGQRM